MLEFCSAAGTAPYLWLCCLLGCWYVYHLGTGKIQRLLHCFELLDLAGPESLELKLLPACLSGKWC
jgi:hypothetical protein